MEKKKDLILNFEDERKKAELAEKFETELKEKRKKVLEKAKEIIGEDGLIWFGDESFIFSQKILEKFDDEVYFYLSWHVLGGSTIPEKHKKSDYKLDFPEEFSVESFYKELLDNLNEIDEFKHKKGTVLTIKNKENDGKN